MPSRRYRILQKRLAVLRQELLPDPFSPVGIYTKKQLDLARGYRVLSHAEIESYIEDTANKLFTKKTDQWINSQKPNSVVVSLLSYFYKYYSEVEEKDPSIRGPLLALPVPIAVIKLAKRWYQARLDKNHGIKEKNLKNLLLPLGIDWAGLDPLWIADMETFGSRRGMVAHQTIGVHTAINPQDDYTLVSGSLLTGLSTFDQLFTAKMNST